MALNFTINSSEAFKSLRNFTANFNWSFNLSDYPSIENMTKIQLSNNTSIVNESVQHFFTPIGDYWIKASGLEAWFYMFLVYFTVGVIWIKTKSMFPTAMALLLFATLIALPATTGQIYVPLEVLTVLYVSLVIGIAGVLYSLLVGRT
ncbi:hypothetical protein DRP04_03370 [Archaeoglobales archaeon]|nr:MAG: hypothetical protein DRP04_03370 [Archaeoglobales archaeon]